MKKEFIFIMSNRNDKAYKMMQKLLQNMKELKSTGHISLLSSKEQKEAFFDYEEWQEKWMAVLNDSPSLLLQEVIGGNAMDFRFSWGGYENAISLGRNIDAAHIKWKRFTCSAIGKSKIPSEACAEDAIVALVAAGANDHLLSRMLDDLKDMPGIFSQNELSFALTLALAIEMRKNGKRAKFLNFFPNLLHVYDLALKKDVSAWFETGDLLKKISSVK